jgi:hypothetical protein
VSDPLVLGFTIWPEPEGDEGEALIAALSLYITQAQKPASDPLEEASVSRWAMVGRRTALLGKHKDPHTGWGRSKAIR